MRAGILLPAVVGLASAAALKRRQEIDYNGVVAAADPVVSIASGVQHQSVAYDPSAAVLSAMAEVTAHPLPVGVDTVAPVERGTSTLRPGRPANLSPQSPTRTRRCVKCRGFSGR